MPLRNVFLKNDFLGLKSTKNCNFEPFSYILRYLHKLPSRELTDKRIAAEFDYVWRHLTGDHTKCDDNCKHKTSSNNKTKQTIGHELIRRGNVNARDKLMARLNFFIFYFYIKNTYST